MTKAQICIYLHVIGRPTGAESAGSREQRKRESAANASSGKDIEIPLRHSLAHVNNMLSSTCLFASSGSQGFEERVNRLMSPSSGIICQLSIHGDCRLLDHYGRLGDSSIIVICLHLPWPWQWHFGQLTVAEAGAFNAICHHSKVANLWP